MRQDADLSLPAMARLVGEFLERLDLRAVTLAQNDWGGAQITNAQIAARLVLSVRTVDHHVAAILARLGARSRREAVAAARSSRSGDQM